MTDGRAGYRLNFQNVTFGNESGSFSCIGVLELIRDTEGGMWVSIRGRGSYQDKQRNVELATVTEIGRLKSRHDRLYDELHELEVSFVDATLQVVGEKATVAKFSALLEAIKNAKKCPLPDVDAAKMRILKADRLREPPKPVPRSPVKPTVKIQSRAQQAVTNARSGLDVTRSPLSPRPPTSDTSPYFTANKQQTSPKKPDTSKRHREDENDPISDPDDTREKKLSPAPRTYVDNSGVQHGRWATTKPASTVMAMPPPKTQSTIQTSITQFTGWVGDLMNVRLNVPSPGSSTQFNGFVNNGNTCYLNAVLQSLTSFHLFASDLLQKEAAFNGKRPEFFASFVEILRLKKLSLNKVIDPKPVKQAIDTHFKHFAGFAQQDAHEFLVSCLAQLEDDLAPSKPKPITQKLVKAEAPSSPKGVGSGPASPKEPKPVPESDLFTDDTRLDAPKGSSTSRLASAPPSPKRQALAPADTAATAAPSDKTVPPADSPAPPPAAIKLSDPVSKNFDSLVEHSLCCESCGATTVIRELFRDLSLEFPTAPPPESKPKPADELKKPAADEAKKLDGDRLLPADDILLLENDEFTWRDDSIAKRGPLRVSAMLSAFFHDEQVERRCENCDGKSTTISHRFHTLPRILILQLKRFKVDMQLQILRKIHERVAWEKELDISALCMPDVRPPVPLPEPEREVANQVAAEIASSDPGPSLGDSFDPKQLEDDDMDPELKQALAESKRDYQEQERRRKQEMEEDAQIELAKQASLREARQRSKRYVLQSVVNHLGATIGSGHYVSDVRDPISGKWRRFDDTKSVEVPEKNVFDSDAREKEGYIFFFVHESLLLNDK